MPHVLVVEDDDKIAAPLVRTLEREGYQVTTAGTVEQAREDDVASLDQFQRVAFPLAEPPLYVDEPWPCGVDHGPGLHFASVR